MATSTRLPAFTAASAPRPVPRATAVKVPPRNRAHDAARMIGLSTILLLTGTSLHFLNLF